MRLLYIDLETTGLDTSYDKIVEIGMIFNEQEKTILLDPGVHIPSEASKVHGISDSDVVGKPKFKDIADVLYRIICSCDYLVGYNIINFDIKMLYTEFLRCGIELPKKDIIDIYQVWNRVEPDRKLTTCYQRFFGEEFKNSHSASADIKATQKCLEEIMRIYDLDLVQSHILSKYGKK